MKSIFGRHHVRANFYHFVSFLYILTMAFWGLHIISDTASTLIGFTLFAIDYLAQMYDPHPDNPGPWFVRHFHRFIDDDEAPVEGPTKQFKIIVAVTAIIIVLYFVTAYAGMFLESITMPV